MKQALSGVVGSIKQIGGVVTGGIAVKALESGSEAIDSLKKKANANLARARGEVDPELKRNVAGLFGGVQISTVLKVAAVGVGVYFLWRMVKK